MAVKFSKKTPRGQYGKAREQYRGAKVGSKGELSAFLRMGKARTKIDRPKLKKI